VPHEMKTMMENVVLNMLKEKFKTPFIMHRTILTQGIGESYLADKIEDWENNLPTNMKLAYLPAAGMVRLRLSATGEHDAKLTKAMDEQLDILDSIAGEFIYGYENDTLEALVGKLLKSKKKTLSTAESCTGGYIAHRITSVPGSSDYYTGSIVAYANKIKENFLDINDSVLKSNGAVSEEVAKLMALHVKEKFQTDYSIACTGIAGPDGGTVDKPVGTVWIAIGTPDGVMTKKLQLGHHRERVIRETSLHALNMLRKILLK
jgi:nicotinamide-nucleotide amidase